MAEAKYIDHFNGWLAFRNGIALRTRERALKVFRSEQEALKAARASKILNGYRHKVR